MVARPPSLQGSYGGQACFHLHPEGSGGPSSALAPKGRQVGGHYPSLTYSIPEVPIGEGVTRARLEVSLESLGEFLRLERDV